MAYDWKRPLNILIFIDLSIKAPINAIESGNIKTKEI